MLIAGAMLRKTTAAALFCSVLSACHSPGPYGHSIEYAPLSEEEKAVHTALEYDPVMASRDAARWSQQSVSLFGIVEKRAKSSGPEVELTLSVRTLAPRNLCEETGEDSCRVTVSDREYGKIDARLKLTTNDAIGAQRVTINSLVRVVGKLEYQGDTPTAIVGTYYRHFPRNEYVTMAARSYMTR